MFASRMSAAAECPSGILTFDRTDATIAASCNVQPLCKGAYVNIQAFRLAVPRYARLVEGIQCP